MKNFWNERFSPTGYIYGETPNAFFAEQLNKLPSGKIILPCDGEGRNSVFAALHNWEVSAFDTSERGKEKALLLAHKNKVSLEYLIEDATLIEYPENQYDVVAFIYAHFPPNIRTSIHQKAITWLKPGGKIILEGFNPNQLKNNSGGPKNEDMLYTETMLKSDFKELKIELLQTAKIQLEEGKHHIGPADVIRFVGIKI
tara:strand:+ start:5801 stop:6397 length:597 start_codon:yes stop_codon:yes gene_type:complete